jgi:hypothetical protein
VPWNGCILIYCHGYRPLGADREAEIDYEGSHYANLLREGWIVSSTSYRRHGVIIKDAMTDVLSLRNFIVNMCKERRDVFVLLDGRSMGGAIATRLAEREPSLFNAVLAVR